MAGALLAIAGSLPIVESYAGRAKRGASQSVPDRPSGSARARRAAISRSNRAERSANWLARELFGQPSLSMTDGRGLDWLKDRVRAGRARDFQRGDLVLLDGWFLARTEARLLALCATLSVP